MTTFSVFFSHVDKITYIMNVYSSDACFFYYMDQTIRQITLSYLYAKYEAVTS